MHYYSGQDSAGLSIGAYIAGKGYWVTPHVPDDSNDRDAANYSVGVEAVADRTVWIGWRMVNGLEGGTYPGVITWTGQQTFSGHWPKVTSVGNLTRRVWRIAASTFTSPNVPAGFTMHHPTSGAIILKTEDTTLSINKTTVELLELLRGSTLVSVKIKCVGHSTYSAGQTNPKFTLVSWTGDNGPVTLSSVVTTAHTSLNWETVTLESTVTPSATVVIDKGKHYGIVVDHPYGTPAVGCYVYDFEVTLTPDTVQ